MRFALYWLRMERKSWMWWMQNGKPFHGECPVAICCQNKDFIHCGECPNIPCELLMKYSLDKEHGDNGMRIGQCRMWANKN